MYAEVLIEYPTKKIDKLFTYIIPDKFKNFIKIGMKVSIPFNNKIINGFVINILAAYDGKYDLKEIDSILDTELVLNDELIELGKYIKESTLCPLICAYQAMLPSSLKLGSKKTNYIKYDKYITLNKNKDKIITFLNNIKKENNQTIILKDLLNNERVLKNKYSNYSVKSLINKGLIKEVLEQEYRINKNNDNKTIRYDLNDEQENAFKTINNCHNNSVFLIEGVTGSGKTEVYLHLIESVINNNKTAIMLVPEISLTMQVVNRFYSWFGNKVAILHSALSEGEKYDEYLKIIRGEVSVVVGTRSAIFAPLNNLGIIIVDEEHSDTYKQDNTPKYNAIDVAKERCKYHDIPLVLGSATPTLETRSRAIKGVYKHLKIKNRTGNAILPNVEIIDMKDEIKKKNFIFSEELIESIKNNIKEHHQSIILLNRRGYSTTISCSNCGYVYKCPNCDITLTYHKSSYSLRCHYCGYTKKKEELCPNCHEKSLNYLGLGTEKAEGELRKIFPNARIVRMDQDTTTKKGSHEKIIKDFKEEKYDILLGTQMISKGLDFPNVTLVGVLNADSSLNIPDFRSNERTFSLLNQVSGRAGRGKHQGKVILQTFNPENKVLEYVKNNDFDGFYNYEMNIRRIMKYPPYYYLIGLKIISSDYELGLKYANRVSNYLKDKIDKETIILGPTTAALFKINNKYNYQIVIKYRFDSNLFNLLKELDNIFLNIVSVNLEIDVNPLHI